MNRQNRRARTGTPIRDNRIYGVHVYRNGYPVATLPMWYRRHFKGSVVTGPAYPTHE